MVIQRIQNLLLLIALLLMSVFCLTPYAQTVATEGSVPSSIFVKDAPVLLVINLVIVALLVISIFTFKNLKRQITITSMAIVLMCASAVTSIFIIYGGEPEAHFIVTGGVLLLIVAAICAIFATRYMRKDQKLLRSYDRLR